MNKYKDRIIRRLDKNNNAIGPWMYVVEANTSYVTTIMAENQNISARLRCTLLPPMRYIVKKENVYLPHSVSVTITKALFKAIECGKQHIIDFDCSEKRFLKIIDEYSLHCNKVFVLRFSNTDCGVMYVSVENVWFHRYPYSGKTVLRVEIGKYICTL